MGAGKISFRSRLGIFLILLPIILILYISIPAGAVTQTIDLPVIEYPLSDYRAQGETPVAVLQEPRQLVITIPKAVRLGDSRNARLILLVPQADDHPAASSPPTSSGLADIYQDNNLVAEVRLDLPGFAISPSGELSSPLSAGNDLTFTWKIKPHQAGSYRGNLWVYINIFPKAGGEKERQALFAIPVQISSSSILGVSTTAVRWSCAGVFLLGMGLVVSAIFQSKKPAR